jgi:hypothetical protein
MPGGRRAYDARVTGTLLILLVVGLLALMPVWRLRAAGWPSHWLFTAWLAISITAFLVIRFPLPFRFLLPILVLAVLAPFVAGPERVARVLGGRDPRPDRGVIIDVTPRLRVDREPGDESGHADPGDDTMAPDEDTRDGRPPT